MRITPDHCPRVCFKVNGLVGSLCDCPIQDVFKFVGVTLIIHISGDDNPAPEGGVFFKYFCMYPNFSHWCSVQL
jgi:hypothetical protein